ncbi:MAG: hypothetical protein GTO05_02815 [Gemmatimonadales bacterium]|nr:hypothetical protein [Gemmatimonadales bacterium]NIS64078.1 hypothetical protein [Gemmatimonadales bacterium]
MGLAYAGLGRGDEAIRHGRRAVELLPISKDAFYGSAPPAHLAQIYAMVGDHDAAIDEIQFLLRVPGRLSVPLLRIDPAWDALREHPRFQRLLLRED